MILTSPTRRSRASAALPLAPPAARPVRPAAEPSVARPRRAASARGRRPWRVVALLLVPLALGACTNSRLVISPLYNRLDDQMRDEFEKLGDFDEAQTALFEAAVGTAHVWHRQSELPAYARLIDEIAASIARPDATTAEDVARWARTIEAHSVAARECHPVNFSFALMKSLTDPEIDFIERRFARERTKNREKYHARTPEERVDYRLKNMRKWAGRIGVDFTAEQNAMLRGALGRQVSLRREYYLLSDRWNAKLFRIAREQDAPDYDARMAAHLGELWTLLEDGHPEEWQRNRELWRDVGLRFVTSMTGEQRATLSTWLDGLSDTLDTISGYEPSFEVGDDPAVGCLVDAAASGATSGPATDADSAS